MKEQKFLKDDYEVPSSQHNYTKLAQGENRLRILGAPIVGQEGWKTGSNGERVVERWPQDEKRPTTEYDNGRPKHFWALPCWNYNEKCIQAWVFTQATIQKALRDLSRSKDWGAPYDYDIIITRSGENMETSYSVMPAPKSSIAKEIQEALIMKPINLNALYDGEDPFEVNENQAAEEDPFESPPLPTEVNIPD